MLMHRCFAIVLFCLTGHLALAQAAIEGHLPVDGQITADGRQVTLSWFDSSRTRQGAVTVKRRALGQTGGATWQTVGANLGVVMKYVDTTTQPGTAYEYQIIRRGRDILDVGYWATGVDLPLDDAPKVAILLRDETLLDPLGPWLSRFQQDLIGDGWDVVAMDAARAGPEPATEVLTKVAALKARLAAQYQQNPDARHAVILIGRLPMVKSGRANPDGHDAVPHVTDLIYGDVDGQWRVAPNGLLLENQLPSDAIEMQVGRIDFWNVSDGNRDTEIRLLRQYFDKNHAWRHGLHGDLRKAYGKPGHLTGEFYGLRNIVPADNITERGHHDAGPDHPWLWGVDFGDWNGRRYFEAHDIRAVFALNFGSGKQKLEAPFNQMSALMAQPWYPVAVGWGGRPAWWLHHMALGGTIGDVHMRTVNNGIAAEPYRASMDYFPTGRYLWRNPIWVNLLGDPTLRAFPVAPPTQATAVAGGESTVITWQPAPGAQSYEVGRSLNGTTFTTIATTSETHVTDPASYEGAVYRIRAIALKSVPAGSFHARSQAVFAATGHPRVTAPALTLAAQPGVPIDLPARFQSPLGQTITALIAPPSVGTVDFAEGQWRYTAPADFVGPVALRYAASTPFQTDVGTLTITVAR